MTILFIALHQPKGPAEEENFRKALAQYEEMQRRHGAESFSVGKDGKTGLLIVVSRWPNKEAMAAAEVEAKKSKSNIDFFRTNQVGPTRYWMGEVEFLESGAEDMKSETS